MPCTRQRHALGVRDTVAVVRIGYGRVSTRDQHPEAQHDALRAARCDEVFIEKASGKLARRPELDRGLAVGQPHGRLMERNNIVSGPTSADLRGVIDRVGKGELSSVEDISAALR